jgi:uncharacterized protein (TIGR01777 family)
MAKIILTGGSGLVGSRLTERLLAEGHQLIHLASSPRKNTKNKVPAVSYDPFADTLPEEARKALLESDIVIHLAGEPIAARRWSEEQKDRIVKSRVQSTKLICSTILEAKKNKEKHPSRYIQASAIGYYGDRGDEWLDESAQPGHDFLARTAVAWEEAASPLSKALSTAFLRIGIVLDRNGGALPKMATPVKLFVGAIPGSGKQWMSWIHIADLVAMIGWLVQHPDLKGPFNAVAPEPVQTADFMKELARTLGRPTLLPYAPEAVLKLAMGEMAILITGGARVSSKKIEQTGFSFQFKNLPAALSDLYA